MTIARPPPLYGDHDSLVPMSESPLPTVSAALQGQSEFDKLTDFAGTSSTKFGADQVQRSRTFAYGSVKPPSANARRKSGRVGRQQLYCALLSRVAQEWRDRLIVGDRIKNGIVYKNSFYGHEAVQMLMEIMDTRDRKLALKLGRALGEQRLFHDVNYETKLVDTFSEIFQFDDLALPTELWDVPVSSDATAISSCMSEFPDLTHKTPVPTNSVLVDVPSGIFTPLTHCYASTCLGKAPCYSSTCPKRRQRAPLSKKALRDTPRASRRKSNGCWSESAPANVIESVSDMERKRQESIHELIHTEVQFVKDLEYIHEMWIWPLQRSSVIRDEQRRSEFIDKVFLNMMTLHAINSQLSEALQARQDKESTLVYHIGDVMLSIVEKFESFIEYGEHQYQAKYTLEQERHSNADFRSFIKIQESHESSRKLELNGYLTKPTTRLGRYTLLLAAVLKYTPSEHEDHASLSKALESIKSLLSRLNIRVGAAKNKFDLACMHRDLVFRHEFDREAVDLLNPSRIIVKRGTLRTGTNTDSREYNVILLDNALLFTKIKVVKGTDRTVVKGQPIPIDFLRVSSPMPKLIKRSSSLLIQLRHTSTVPLENTAGTNPGAPTASMGSVSIVFSHLGRDSETFTLYASSASIRTLWIEAIRKLQEERRTTVFNLVPTSQARAPMQKVNHIVTFNTGKQYLLAADNGVYVGHVGQETEPRCVLALDNATQVHVDEPSALMLVLSKKGLYEFDMNILNGPLLGLSAGHKVRANVPFFHVGQIADCRTVVCVPSLRNSKVFIYEVIPKWPVESQLRRASVGFFGTRSSGLRIKRFKHIYVRSEVWAISLTPSKMLVTGPRGMIMIDLFTDKIQDVLDAKDPHLRFVTRYENEATQPLLRHSVKRISLFRNEELSHYLMCYNEYAFYIDKTGRRAYPKFLIEWNGLPQTFAFIPPYVIAIAPSIIEIRHLFTGKLVQVIQGDQMRCLNNGLGGSSKQIHILMPTHNGRDKIFKLELCPQTAAS